VSDIQWPQKTQEFHNHHFDSTMWDHFVPRDDDIVISTYAKSGTTWLQQIVSQLLFNGEAGLEVAHMSPWIDLRVPPHFVKMPEVEAQTHRRFVKTHLPVPALRFFPQAKYLYIGRDARDAIWSMHNHHLNANAKWYGALNETPGRVGPPIAPPPESPREYFLEWLEKDGHPLWPYWENIRSWWAIRDLPNVHLMHFANMKADLPGQIREVAKFLDIEIDEAKWDDILLHCSFAYMKENATKSVPLGGAFWDAGAKVFIHKGVNGRWRDTLSADESAAFEARAVQELGAECAHFMATGELP